MNGASWLLSSCSVPKTLETLKDLKQMHAYTSNCTKEIAYSRFLFFFSFFAHFCYEDGFSNVTSFLNTHD